MNPIPRLWHWDNDRRLERPALTGHDGGGGHHRSQGTPPMVGIAADARLRLLIRRPQREGRGSRLRQPLHLGPRHRLCPQAEASLARGRVLELLCATTVVA
jgi:hypothetical protein